MTAAGAKGGFDNEAEIIASFNSMDSDAIIWLQHMGHNPSEISRVSAFKAQPRIKPDVICEIYDRNGELTSVERLSAKKASSKVGFNQIDRGDVIGRYKSLWPDMPALTVEGLRLFTGNLPPISKSRNPKRMYFDELPQDHRDSILGFLKANKLDITRDLLAGREPNMANWFLGRDLSRNRWTLLPIEDAIEFYSTGSVEPTERGGIKFGTLTIQRKGGDKGKPSATDLQFKFNPNLIGQVSGDQ
jgi:hypothetical protein